jgi:Zinc finger, C3HC4 type (RING finger)
VSSSAAMGAAEPQHAQEANGVDDIVRRSAKRLAACLACDICCGLLVEPLTSPQCMHCFCRECITGFIMQGQVRRFKSPVALVKLQQLDFDGF